MSSHPSPRNIWHYLYIGSSLFQRLSSFLVGVGVTSLVGYYFLVQDVKRYVWGTTKLSSAGVWSLMSSEISIGDSRFTK